VEYSVLILKPKIKIIILLVVLYACDVWPLTLRELHRLRVFENRTLRRIFQCGREEVAGGWWTLHNEELHNWNASLSNSKVIKSWIRWVGYAACIEKTRNAYKILMGKQEEKKPFGKPRHWWEDSNRMDLSEIV